MILCLALLCVAATDTRADADASATYLANAGVLLQDGESKVLIDPLFRLSHEYYLSVPGPMENSMLNGDAPFDGVDALLVTHYHLDHFSPNLLLNYLMINPGVQLFAPEQAGAALRRYASEDDSPLLERVTELNLSHFGEPFRHELGEILIEAVRIPHSGWPDANRGTQNLAYRVTLNQAATVLHLGDSAPQADLFEKFSDYWNERKPHMVMAPYWFFLEGDGRRILDSILGGASSVGVHVPSEVPTDPDHRRAEHRDLNIFTKPGEIRPIPHAE